MAKKQFKIRVQLVFTGEVNVMAHDRKEAEHLAQCLIPSIGHVEALAEGIKDFNVSQKGETVVKRREEVCDEA